MKTTLEILKDALLQGKVLTKFDFMRITPQNSVCLAQRVEELRNDYGWNVLDRNVEGKGTLKEYYLPEEEIKRLLEGEQLKLGLPGFHND